MVTSIENCTVSMGLESFINTLFPEPSKYKELTFTRYAWAKMMAYCHLIDKYEITGFGRVVDDKVIDVRILKQKVQSAMVDCDEDAMTEFLISLPVDQMGQWILDWHSHVDMGAFASGTDTTNYEKQYNARLKKQYPYLIVNKRQEYCCKCYVNPSRSTDIALRIENEPITSEQIEAIYNECKADIESLCSRTVYTHSKKANKNSVTSGYNYYGSSYYDDDDYGSYYSSYYNKHYGKSSNLDKLPTAHNGGSLTKKKDEEDYDEEVAKNMQEIDERAYQQALEFKNNADPDDFCESCGIYLQTATEYDRGLCEDCWEKLNNQEKFNWSSERYGLTKK